MKSFKQFLNKRVLTVSALAKKHGVDTAYIERQLKRGIAVEHEHTSKLKVARQIALAHLGEDPDYYKKLKKVEKKQINEVVDLSKHIVAAVGNLRKQGYGEHTITAKLRDELKLGDYNQLTLTRAVEAKKDVYPDVYHPRNKRTAPHLIPKKFGKSEELESAFKMRKMGLSDPEIAKKFKISKETLRIKLRDNSDHPSYHPPVGEYRPTNHPDIVRAIVGLSHRGHSASAVAKFMGDNITKNKVIGILNRTSDQDKSDIVKGLSNNPPPQYTEHKDKPVKINKGGKPSWSKYRKITEERLTTILSKVRL
jgi:hypothetical protein